MIAGKTLVHAGHVSPRILEMTIIEGMGGLVPTGVRDVLSTL